MRRTIVRSSLIAGALLGASCGEGAARPPATIVVVPSSSPDVTPTASPAEPDMDLAARLAREMVEPRGLGLRALYTWTTPAQIEELGRTRVLLSRAESPTRGKSFFDRRRIAQRWPIGKIFDEPALVKRRFAWPTAWATILGGDAESYGDRLVRVVLKPGSIFAQFQPEDPHHWMFFDVNGHTVSEADAIRQAHRIAGVYHVFAGEDGAEAAPYREVVLCNEAMIEEWSVDTDETRSEITRALDLLRRLRAEIERAPPDRAARLWGRAVAREVWPARPKRLRIRPVWEASLAFANDRYQLDAASLDALVKALEAASVAAGSGQALRHRPTVAFPGFDVDPSVPPVPGALPTMTMIGHKKPVKCVPVGTFGCWPLGVPWLVTTRAYALVHRVAPLRTR